MQNMQLIRAIDFRLRLLESNAPAQRIGRIDDSLVPFLHAYIQGGMIRKSVAQQRVCAGVPGCGNSVGNSDCLLPDWPRIGYLKNS